MIAFKKGKYKNVSACLMLYWRLFYEHSPCCRALLKTLMSLSWTPMPVLRLNESVALSLLPRFIEPFAWVLKK